MEHSKCNHEWGIATGLLDSSGKKTIYNCNNCLATKIEIRADVMDHDNNMTHKYSEVIIDSYGKPELLRYWLKKVGDP